MEELKQKIGSCVVSIMQDRRRAFDGKYRLYVRFTIVKERYYHPIGEAWDIGDYDRVMATDHRTGARGRSDSNRERKRVLAEILDSYVRRIRELNETTVLSIGKIKNLLIGRSTEASFISVWDEVIRNRRAGTAESYRIARNSFMKCLGLAGWNGADRNEDRISRLGFAVDASLIHEWVQKLTDEGKSKTSIGIYLRACRVVVNECCKMGYMAKGKDYPFGEDGSDRVSIPRGKDRKHESLSVEKMTELYNVFLNKSYPEVWTEDYRKEVHESLGLFLFMYLANGMNLADVARLKYDRFFKISKGTAIRFERTKTKDRAEKASEVIVPVIPQLNIIMKRIAAPCEMGERMFPRLLQGARTDKEIMRRVQQENQNIRKRLRNLTEAMGWYEQISPTWCRHSFATNLIHAGVPQAYVSEAMGHSTGGSVTMGYVGRYPIERQMEYNSKLLDNDEAEETGSMIDNNDLRRMIDGLSDEQRKMVLLMLNGKYK